MIGPTHPLVVAAFGGLATIIAGLISFVAGLRNARRGERLNAVRLLFDAHVKLHEEPIREIFFQLKWDRFSFRLPPERDLPIRLAPDHGTDLDTDKERGLVAFLDLMEMVEQAHATGLISAKQLKGTTVGYAMFLKRHRGTVKGYVDFTKARDKREQFYGEAWEGT